MTRILCGCCDGAGCDVCAGAGGWAGFDYDRLPRRDRAWTGPRPVLPDTETANRRDAQAGDPA